MAYVFQQFHFSPEELPLGRFAQLNHLASHLTLAVSVDSHPHLCVRSRSHFSVCDGKQIIEELRDISLGLIHRVLGLPLYLPLGDCWRLPKTLDSDT